MSLFQYNVLLICNVLQFIKHFHIHDFVWVLTLTVPWDICQSVSQSGVIFCHLYMGRLGFGKVKYLPVFLQNERVSLARPVNNFVLQGYGKIRSIILPLYFRVLLSFPCVT